MKPKNNKTSVKDNPSSNNNNNTKSGDELDLYVQLLTDEEPHSLNNDNSNDKHDNKW